MIRQEGLAVGVAIFVAIVALAAAPDTRLAAFDAGWWTMTVATPASVISNHAMIRPSVIT